MPTDEVVEVKDIVEDTLDLVDDAAQILRKTSRVTFFGVQFASLAIGVAAGYFLAKKRLEKKYDEIARQEIEEAREYYARVQKPASPTELAKRYLDEQKSQPENDSEDSDLTQLREITRSYQSNDIQEARETLEETEEPVEEPGNPPIVERNVFVEDEEKSWDYDYELSQRTEDTPYIIHHDEFMGTEKDYQQITLNYYDGDDTLTDENDQPVNDTDNLVGDDNLLKFGHGSKDNKVVYIRNDRLELEFEVIRNQGKYVEQVLGFIEHSDDDRRPRRFRNHDE